MEKDNDINNAETVIKIEHLCKNYKMYGRKKDRLLETILPKYQNHKEFNAINDLNLEIKKGEIVGILGKNGAGKSTLLKMITGVVTPTSGTIEVKGRISSLLELGTAFNQELTGEENIYQHGEVMGLTREQIEATKQDIIDFADIGEHLYQPVKTYSSGMFARIAFACAINVNPDILIVDEVLSVGDMAFQLKCIRQMKKMIEKGITILYVSHNSESIMSLCNRAIWLMDGQVYEDGEVREVVKKYNVYMTHGYTEKNTNSKTVDGKNLDIEIEKKSSITKIGNNKAFIKKFNYSLVKNAGDTMVEKWEDEQELVLYIEVYEDIQNPMFGFTINHYGGLPIFHFNTFMLKDKLCELKANKEYKMTFKFKIPKLNNGRYGLSFSLDDGIPGLSDIVCRMDNILIFSVAEKSEEKQYGIIFVEDKDIKIEEI